MKVLYLDLGMGAAGDMLTAALLELFPEEKRAGIVERLNKIGIPGVEYKAEVSVKCGIKGTHMSVLVHGEEEDEGGGAHEHEHGAEETCGHDETGAKTLSYENEHEEGTHGHGGHEHESHGHSGHAHHHSHSSMHGISHIVNEHMSVPDAVRKDVMDVYGVIADAESRVHGAPVDEIHFHEVGSMDAVADITAVCMLIRELAPDRIIASPVSTGSGQVRCAHGIMPVPAPATALILEGVPVADNGIKGELCTPTGAALVRHFADGFGGMPAMRMESIGYGMGKKDFERANCVRAILGTADDGAAEDNEASDSNASGGHSGGATDSIYELSANIDDMTAEEMGFAFGMIQEAGAFDVCAVPVFMKKNRPGYMLKVIVSAGSKDDVIKAIFKHTTTIGIREAAMHRYILDREESEVETAYGRVRYKSVSGYGVSRRKFEYDDLAAIAKAQGITLAEARRIAAHSK